LLKTLEAFGSRKGMCFVCLSIHAMIAIQTHIVSGTAKVREKEGDLDYENSACDYDMRSCFVKK
jgi:hypothetical protein